jgi:hypothetical protein
MPNEFLLTALSRDPDVIRASDCAGVDRIGIDVERLGKHLRQDPSTGARISDHNLEDLETVKANATTADVFVRLNPPHDNSRAEIDRALELGAQVVMLPYFTKTCEVKSFLEWIAGRAKAVLLVETPAAAARIREIVSLPGVTEVMVGLNDLALGLGLSHPLQVLSSELMIALAMQVRDAGVRFGFGGVGRRNDITLPIAADLIYAQYAMLGATTAWLARSFYRGLEIGQIQEAVRDVRERLAFWHAQPGAVLERQREGLAAALRSL